MKTFLLDTNIVSEAMKPKPNPVVEQWLDQQVLVFLSVITVEEIYAGLFHKDTHNKMVWFDNLLRFQAQVFDVTPDVAAHSAEMRGLFRQRGIMRSQPDMLIAATAYQHNLTLVTRNIKDFEACGVAVFNPFPD